jgi:hypothetical protein
VSARRRHRATLRHDARTSPRDLASSCSRAGASGVDFG